MIDDLFHDVNDNIQAACSDAPRDVDQQTPTEGTRKHLKLIDIRIKYHYRLQKLLIYF